MKEKIREYIKQLVNEMFIQETKDVKAMYKKAGMEPPHPGKGIHTKKFHKCVTSVGDDKGKNPYAICMSSLGKGKAVKKSHQREGIMTENELGDEFFEITTPINSSDFKIFELVVNQGIDSHLEGFTKSEFKQKGDRYSFNFHKSELPILIRRLRDMGTEEAESWADDINDSANPTYLKAMANHNPDKEINEDLDNRNNKVNYELDLSLLNFFQKLYDKNPKNEYLKNKLDAQKEVMKQYGGINEGQNSFESYVEEIKNKLQQLDSGNTIIQVINGDFTGNAEKYKNSTWNNITNYFKNNFEKGIPAETTASFTRDKWYGV